MHMEPGENQVVRRLGVIGKAKYQTIKVTGVLVLCFIVCSMPYYSMGFWYVTAHFIFSFSKDMVTRWWLDRASAKAADFRLSKLLWALASANNCFNPLLYRMVGQGRSVTYCM